MEIKFIAYFTLIFSFVISQHAFAQKEEGNSSTFEQLKSDFKGDTFKAGAYKFNDIKVGELKKADPELLKKLGLKNEICRVVVGTYLLEYWGRCYTFRPYAQSCDDCILLWYDYNNDHLVQPMKELRAVCQRSLNPCSIHVQKRESCK